jgi:hypothetical protein
VRTLLASCLVVVDVEAFRTLKQCLQQIFPNTQIMEEASLSLRSFTTKKLVVDIFIPEHNVAIEYQGTNIVHCLSLS